MKRAEFLVLATIAIASLAIFSRQQGVAQQAGGRLPGARPEIDASRYPSLQAAFDAVPAEGGLVLIPAGHFFVDQPLLVRRGDVCIEGAGTATQIENRNVDGKPAILLAHPEAKLGMGKQRKHELWRIRLSNMRITGNPKSGHGIEARNINELFIHGVSISYNGGDGVFLDHCYEDPRISNSLLTYNKKVGVNLLGCHDIVVSANQFEENQDALHCFDGFNLCMTGNNLDDHLGRGVVIENTYGSVLSGNMIEECAGDAVVLDRDCYGITVSANVIAHNGGGVILEDAHGCAVSANTFTLMKNEALRISPISGRIAVSGNNFCNSYIGEGLVRRNTDDLEAGGMTIDGAAQVGVTGNVFASVRPKAFTITGKPVDVLFSNNLLTDVKSDHEQLDKSIVGGNLYHAEPAEKK